MDGSGETMIYCKTCEERTRHLDARPNHKMHLVVAILTLGLWLIPWGLLTLLAPDPICIHCGSQVSWWQFRR